VRSSGDGVATDLRGLVRDGVIASSGVGGGDRVWMMARVSRSREGKEEKNEPRALRSLGAEKALSPE
jgi:hypothetical protein